VSLTLRLYTDFVCPFCFVAEQSTVPELLAEFDIALDWCGFELHPNTPRGGRPLTDLFGPIDLDALHARTRKFGMSFGLRDFQPPNRLQNTRRALAIAEYARDEALLEAFRAAAFEGHFRQGKDFDVDEDLRAIAEAAGLDPQKALAAADETEYLTRVNERQSAARRAGVRGIPTFEFGEDRITGCQPYPVLRDAALRAGAVAR
jgi:predicted DsbA family dithiol-disulfide isomerase